MLFIHVFFSQWVFYNMKNCFFVIPLFKGLVGLMVFTLYYYSIKCKLKARGKCYMHCIYTYGFNSMYIVVNPLQDNTKFIIAIVNFWHLWSFISQIKRNLLIICFLSYLLRTTNGVGLIIDNYLLNGNMLAVITNGNIRPVSMLPLLTNLNTVKMLTQHSGVVWNYE